MSFSATTVWSRYILANTWTCGRTASFFRAVVAWISCTGWRFNTLLGHPDYPGFITFSLDQRKGRNYLDIHGNIPTLGPNGSWFIFSDPAALAARGYYLVVANHVWGGFAARLRKL